MDGASTDGTVELLESYGDRITWRSKPDDGPFEAINRGWQLGNGQILAWLNADDVWVPGAARVAAEHFTNHPDTDILHGDCGLIDDHNRFIGLVPVRRWNFHASLLHCDHFLMQSATFFSRRIVERVGGLYPSWTHDQEFWLRAAMAGGKFTDVSTHLANVRVGDGHMHDNADVMIPARVDMTRRVFESPDLPVEFLHLRAEALSNAYVRGFDLLKPRRREDWKWGWYCLSGAIRACPRNTPHVVAEILRRVAVRLAEAGVPGVGQVGPAAKRLASSRTVEVFLLAMIWLEVRRGRKAR